MIKVCLLLENFFSYLSGSGLTAIFLKTLEFKKTGKICKLNASLDISKL